MVFGRDRNGAAVAPVGVDERRALRGQVDLLDLADEDEMRAPEQGGLQLAVEGDDRVIDDRRSGRAAVPGDRAEPVFVEMLEPAGEQVGDEALVAAESTLAQKRRFCRIASQAGLRWWTLISSEGLRVSAETDVMDETVTP
jgi:hypothetical protein